MSIPSCELHRFHIQTWIQEAPQFTTTTVASPWSKPPAEYLIYKTLPMRIQKIDDRSAVISYFGDWILVDDEQGYDGTSTRTSSAGATAKFSFYGTTVSVQGTVPSSGLGSVMNASYAIDDIPANISSVIQNSFKTLYRQQLFLQTNLSYAQHTLEITNLGDVYYLDYIVIGSPIPSLTSMIRAPSSTMYMRSLPPTASSSVSVVPQGVSSPPNSNTPSVGIIAGATGAGVVVAVLIIVALLVWRIRRKKQARGVDTPELSTWIGSRGAGFNTPVHEETDSEIEDSASKRHNHIFSQRSLMILVLAVWSPLTAHPSRVAALHMPVAFVQ
ncbi:hypothetical protein B0H34DRAFT_98218 [Crassisporium funariophilum]|nr:hypothetical protein B0H34DRAFT_98218 [Crassisporium funariophilum]